MQKSRDGSKTPSHDDANEDEEQNTLSAGQTVVDREADPDDRNTAVVISRLDIPAYAVEIDALGGKSVADVNEDYPASAPVVTVAFADALEQALGEWEDIPAESLQPICDYQGVQTYSYPVPRLREVDGE